MILCKMQSTDQSSGQSQNDGKICEDTEVIDLLRTLINWKRNIYDPSKNRDQDQDQDQDQDKDQDKVQAENTNKQVTQLGSDNPFNPPENIHPALNIEIREKLRQLHQDKKLFMYTFYDTIEELLGQRKVKEAYIWAYYGYNMMSRKDEQTRVEYVKETMDIFRPFIENEIEGVDEDSDFRDVSID